MATILVVGTSGSFRKLLWLILQESGYVATEIAWDERTLATLRSYAAPCVVVLDDWAPLTGAIVVLQAAERETTLRRHAFVVISADYERMRITHRGLLDTLSAPVLAKPFEMQALLEAVGQAQQRLDDQGLREVGQG